MLLDYVIMSLPRTIAVFFIAPDQLMNFLLFLQEIEAAECSEDTQVCACSTGYRAKTDGEVERCVQTVIGDPCTRDKDCAMEGGDCISGKLYF